MEYLLVRWIKLKSKGLNTESIKNVFGQMNTVRSSWEDMFSFVGKNMDDKSLKEFKSVFGDKFKSFLGSNYEIFQNKSLLPWLNYKPTKQLIGKMKTEIIKQAEMGGNKITPETAEKYINEIIKSATLPNKKSLAILLYASIFLEKLNFLITKRKQSPDSPVAKSLKKTLLYCLL